MNPNSRMSFSNLRDEPSRNDPPPTLPSSGEKRDAFELDTTRLFYMRSSKYTGSFRHTWDFYLVDLDMKIVDVHWANGKHIELSGTDAKAFLRIVRDHQANEFENLN